MLYKFYKLEAIEIKLSSVIPALTKYLLEAQFPESLEEIILFGSYAKGLQHVGSDVDLALIFPDMYIVSPKERSVIRAVLDDFDDSVQINIFCTTKSALINATKQLDANYWIHKEGVQLWKKSPTNTLAPAI